DRSLYGSAVFILAARADIPSEELRRRFPAQLKIGPVEKITDLVRLHLPGVPVHAVPVAPRQIPYHAGLAHFELDQTHPLWAQRQTAGGVAMHVAGEFPGLAMEFWAIRSGVGASHAEQRRSVLSAGRDEAPAAAGRGPAAVGRFAPHADVGAARRRVV